MNIQIYLNKPPPMSLSVSLPRRLYDLSGKIDHCFCQKKKYFSSFQDQKTSARKWWLTEYNGLTRRISCCFFGNILFMRSCLQSSMFLRSLIYANTWERTGETLSDCLLSNFISDMSNRNVLSLITNWWIGNFGWIN
jgi:hypothetical protein